MGRMRLGFAATLFLLTGSLAVAGTLSGGFNYTTSKTGTVTISPLGGPTAATVGPGAFTFCVGPNSDNCASSGLYGSVDISSSQVAFNFFGGTNPATGTFVVQLTGLSGDITNVVHHSGALGSGTFALTSFTSDSMTFTGTVNGGAFAAGGAVVFDVTTSSPGAAPLPPTLILILAGLGVTVLYAGARRWAVPH